jgi:hypothetical protein
MKLQSITQTVSATMAACALSFALAPVMSAAEVPKGLSTYRMEGKIGPYSIGLNLLVRDNVDFADGHYFYASKMLDIPLEGHVDGEDINLQERGGGIFHLHLVSNDSAKGEKLTFYNSTGLQGTWTRGAKTYPVTLQITSAFDGPVPTPWYSDVTKEPDAAFEARVRRFLRAVIAGNKGATANAVSFPLQVNGSRNFVVRNRADLLAKWDNIFKPTLVAQLRNAIPHQMSVHDGLAMVADGTVWFDAKGAMVINEME